MIQVIEKKFRLENPYKPDEKIVQDVIISDTPQYDYEGSPWVAIDTEFLTLDLPYDRLCVIQIASPGAADDEQRVEFVWVWEQVKSGHNLHKKVEKLLQSFFEREDLEVLMHVSTADLPRLAKLINEQEFQGKLFDTKAAARVVIRNTNRYGMDDLITNLVNPKFNKDKYITGSQWDLQPAVWSDKMIEYAMNDVLYLHPLKIALERIALRRGLDHHLDVAMKALPMVNQLYLTGLTEQIFGY